MAHLNPSITPKPVADSNVELEQMVRDAICEHRRLASTADVAYAKWEEASDAPQMSEEVRMQVRYRYMRAMVALRQQQEELNIIINRLGYIPKSKS